MYMRHQPDKLEMKIKDGERLFQTQEYVLVPDAEYIRRQRELMKFGFDRDQQRTS